MGVRRRYLGGACVLPVLGARPNARILLIRTPDRLIGSELLELPAGAIEPGESPEEAGARELREETGFAAATLTPVSRFHTAPGRLAEPMHAFLALELTRVDPGPEEGLELTAWDLEDALCAVDDGRITDAKSMLTLLLARERGLI